MAVSRGSVVFFCIGTLFVLYLFSIASAEASLADKSSEPSHIHAVSHTGRGCKGGLDSDKGNQCQDSNDDDDDNDLDDDVDDTYKVVDDVKVSLSRGGGNKFAAVPEGFEDESSDEDAETDPDQFDVLGH